jgi:hypothetical protein
MEAILHLIDWISYIALDRLGQLYCPYKFGSAILPLIGLGQAILPVIDGHILSSAI